MKNGSGALRAILDAFGGKIEYGFLHFSFLIFNFEFLILNSYFSRLHFLSFYVKLLT